MERTLIILKPDAVQRGFVGEVLGRFESKGLKIVGLKMMLIDKPLAERHYGVHKDKDFYEPLIRFITSAPVVAAIVEGKEACRVVRKMVGVTFGPDAEAGTIRGDLAMSKRFNLIHASDSPETAEKETKLFFDKSEIFDYELGLQGWVYDYSTGEPV
jgi:nucleoside-diphosphate kinase